MMARIRAARRGRTVLGSPPQKEEEEEEAEEDEEEEEGEGKGGSFAGWLGVERGGGGVDPPRRLAPEGDHHEGEGVRVAAAKTRARPKAERMSENVDPTGVDVDTVRSLAPSPEGPVRVAGAGVARG
jgi:hypothetical protein